MEKKILYIEDDFFIGDLYRRQLLQAGYVVDIVQDGKSGLEQALRGNYNLILLDVMLPGMDGIEILKHLKTEPSTQKIPIVMLSNLAQDSVMQESKTLGAEAYWIKDQMLPAQLVEEVNNIFFKIENGLAVTATQEPTGNDVNNP
jgi:CheY-like chemotaxis protein